DPPNLDKSSESNGLPHCNTEFFNSIGGVRTFAAGARSSQQLLGSRRSRLAVLEKSLKATKVRLAALKTATFEFSQQAALASLPES
ncbi:hypothetical protein, partial [uncultured Roseobacter sp.]|uniref:hypothetical protein n=1 Tax=uncultured Roseobacter sp. TaxID=114847 RepID=UPI00262E621C